LTSGQFVHVHDCASSTRICTWPLPSSTFTGALPLPATTHCPASRRSPRSRRGASTTARPPRSRLHNHPLRRGAPAPGV